MKYLIGLVLLLVSGTAGAQQYRLSYDPSTVPELYNNTRVVLEERVAESYEPYRGRYRIRANNGSLDRDQFSYTNEELDATGGVFRFTVAVEGREIPLSLSLPVLKDLRFNMYTDSIKPILNFYVNVEGVFSSGRIFPLTEQQVKLSSDIGTVMGMEWKAPPGIKPEKVLFTAEAMDKPQLRKSTVMFLKKQADPRDREGYEEGPPVRKR